MPFGGGCCDLLENYYLCAIRNNQVTKDRVTFVGCDLLENYYLCAIRNNTLS